MTLKCRPASPADVEIATYLIHGSAERTVEHVYGTRNKRSMDFLRYSFSRGKGFLGYENQLVGLVNEQIAAIGTFYGRREYMPLSIATIRHVFEFYSVKEALGVISRLSALKRIGPPPTKHMGYLANFCVAPNFRGRGVGADYFRWLIDRAFEKGYQTLALDVAADNDVAERLYKKLGFTVEKLQHFHRDRTPGPIADTKRMVLVSNSKSKSAAPASLGAGKMMKGAENG